MELFILSTLTGVTTMLGAIAALLFGQPGRKILAFYLGMSAGIITLVIAVDLLPAAFDQGPIEAVGVGLGIGLLTMLLVYECLQRMMGDQPVSVNPKKREYLRMGYMIALAIGIHNIPEGIAIGAGFETEHELGVLMALSIALHNVPEGIGMAIPLVLAGMRKRWVAILSLAISLCIPAGAWLGKCFFVGSPFLVAIGISFAAGAMGFIVWKEIGPTSMKYNRLFAQVGMLASLALIYIIHALR